MVWANIEQRLKNALTVEIAFPAGTIWLPAAHLTIDEWLTSIAETDDELRELNIPRIRFLQNHWPIVNLIELEWDDAFASRRTIAAMYVGRRAYILLSDWSEYQVIAAIEPKDNASLYRIVIGKLLENRSFIRTRPTHVRNRRPDLVPEFVATDEDGAPMHSMTAGSKRDERWNIFVSDILVGWIPKWLNIPEMGFWRQDIPESVSLADKGEIVMKYKPTYGDKQRDAQKRKKEEELRAKETPPTAKTPGAEEEHVAADDSHVAKDKKEHRPAA
jgi:hypothetical protein